MFHRMRIRCWHIATIIFPHHVNAWPKGFYDSLSPPNPPASIAFHKALLASHSLTDGMLGNV